MKILFVSSGNAKNGISSLIYNQGLSLIQDNVSVDFFTIKGKGIKSYVKNIFLLRNHLKLNHYDIVHSHYSLSSFVAALAMAKPLFVSLMGSDVKSNKIYHPIIYFFHYFFWSVTIVKSEDMKKSIKINKLHIIPNGVNVNKFRELNKKECQEKLKWSNNKKHILFGADPLRIEKNFTLAQKALTILDNKLNYELHYLKDISFEDVLLYINASDVLLITSFYEGSPNIIKEAMACNCPIVTTNVGDVEWVIDNTKGCFITTYNPNDIAQKLIKVLNSDKRTDGRKRIIDLGLDSISIAKKLISIYNETLNKEKRINILTFQPK